MDIENYNSTSENDDIEHQESISENKDVENESISKDEDIENYNSTSENNDTGHQEPTSENKIDKKKIALAGIVLAAILMIIVLISSVISEKFKSISEEKKMKQQQQEAIESNTQRKKIVENIGYAGQKSEYLKQQETVNTTNNNVSNNNQTQTKIQPTKEIKSEEIEIVDESLQAYYEQLLQEELAARKSIIRFDDSDTEKSSNNGFFPTQAQNSTPNLNMPNMGNLLEQDQNKIKEKKEFLKGTDEDNLSIYNPFETVNPLSQYQVNAGAIIPGVFITGVKSTLPGRMIGQVRENVYDSTTGNYLLIPKGARLIGMYDSNVTFGQDRIMIIWERIIFPSGKSIQLNRFSGTDLSGYAGVTGKVNNHYGKLLTSVVLSSIIGAGTAIVDDDDDDKNWKDEAGRGAGEQIINIGTKFAEKVMNISPEITIATGQKFNIIVNSDLILEPLE